MIWAMVLAGVAGWFAFPSGRDIVARRSWIRSMWTRWWKQRSSQQRSIARSRRRWIALLAADLAAEVRAGRQPELAWEGLWSRGPLYDTRGLLVHRDPIIDVMRAAATSPGGRGLDRLAACWEVAQVAGAGLADALDKVASSLAAESEISDEIDGQLAGPRASVRLLVGLPVFALILGRSLGADPVAVLLNTWYGWACLVSGVALLAAGWRWSHAQVRSVTPWPDQ